MNIKNNLKIFSIILTFALLLQAMPMSAFASLADELYEEYIDEPDATEFVSDSEEEPAEEAYIVFEDENKRELSSKQFRMSDGSFMAVSYPEQVHFIDNDGKYADIDNRLIYSETKEENDFSGYSNKANSFNIKFNETLFAENAVIYRLAKGDRTFSLERIQGENSYISNANADATITQAKDDADPFEKEGDAAGELAFVSSKISYSNEENKVDFDYVLIGNHINEYIVIKEKLDNYTFTYRISAEGLTAAKDENGGIVFTDDSGEIIYSIPAPFMYDSNGVYSDAVDYELTEADGAYILTVYSNEDWINEEDRAFPVTIDPDLYIGKYNSSDVDDADVREGVPTQQQGSYQYMTCGYSNYVGDKEMLMLVKINNLPTLPNAAVIVDARLNMKQLYEFSDPTKPVFVGDTAIDFAARRITSSWSESSVTWNTKPSANSTILDYRTASTSTPGCYLAFDITEAAVMWYNGTATNYGIEIRTMETHNGYHYTYFCASENPNQYSTVLPMFKFSYRDNKGIEDYWTFHSASAADAGTVYVNDFTGNPVVITELFTTAGNIMPISIGLVYNGYLAGKYFTSGNAITADFTNMQLGAGFKLNVQETVVQKVVGSLTYYVHSDSDGTEHYYYNFDGGSTYYSEDGLGFKITKNSSTYVLSNEVGDKKTFNSSGYLTKVEDADGNTQTYTYSSGKLTKITSKPSGSASTQTVEFSYNNGFLSSIDSGSDLYSISYSSTTPKRITSITRSIYYNGSLGNGGNVTFGYSGNKLNSIQSNSTGKRVELEYNTTGKTIKLKERVNSSYGQSIAFNYLEEKKTEIITSGLNDELEYVAGGNNSNIDDIFTTYVFDYHGRTITAYTKDLSGNIVSVSNAAYNTTTGKSKAVNGISKSGSIGCPSVNLVKNSSIENGWSSWLGYIDEPNHQNETSTSYSFVGNKSMKFTASGSGTSRMTQAFTLTAGKSYTFSAYIKTVGLVGTGIYLSVPGVTGAQSIKLTGTTDTSIQNGWQRLYVTFTPSSSGTYNPKVYFSASSGTAYIDAVQFEEGSIGAYNLVENGSLTNGSTEWTLSSGATVSSNKLNLTGNHSANVTATQTVKLNMPVNTTYMLSAWATGNSADTDVDENNTTNAVDPYQKARTFQVKATIYYRTSSGTLSSTTTIGIAKFNSDTNQLQYSITPVVPNLSSVGSLSKQDYAIIEISYNKNINSAQFSKVSFTAEPAQTYAYDSSGNLTNVQNADGNIPAYEFANGVDLSKVSNSDGSSYNISYYTETNATHRIKEIKDANNVIAAYEYYSNGNVNKVTVRPSSGTKTIVTSTTYTPDGRFVSTKTDDRNKVTTYSYDTNKGILNYVIDANSHKTAYKYNIYKAITDVFADFDNDNSIDNNEPKVSYVYDSNRNLTQITTRTSTYNLSYDSYGNVISITIGNSSTPFVTYTYANNNGKLTRTTYANGKYFENVYDSLDRVVSVKYNGTVRYKVSYSKEGYVAVISDVENGIEYQYEYDRLGRLIRNYEIENGTVRTIISVNYDSKGRTTNTSYKNDGYTARSSSTSYDSKGRISIIRPANTDYIIPSYDSFGRVSSIEYSNSLLSRIYTKNYTYFSYTDSNESRTSSIARTLGYSFEDGSLFVYYYTYDNVGNLNTVKKGSVTEHSYLYDNIDQLTGESCDTVGKSFEYSYDLGGNITSVKTYSGNTLVNTDTYSYTNSNWPDQLTKFNNHTITYDAIGNPLSYYNGSSYTFTWKDGRKLATLNKGSTSVSYKYNNDGCRFEKTVNGVVHKYYLFDSTITAETIIDGNDITKIEYFNDENGPYAFSVGGTIYYYVKSIQGDVLEIRNASGAVVVEYVYDAWGRVLSTTGTLASTIGVLNPIRYHGYYYDTESGLYYLTQRYYDPQIRRFISPDSETVLLSNYSGILDTNIYAFCDNNPVMRSDDDGGFWHIIAGAVIGAIGGAVSSIVSQAISGQEINWKAVGISAVGGAIGGAITTACPCLGPVATGLVQGTISAATYAATEKIAYGRDPSIKDVVTVGVTSGITAGCMKYVAQSLGVVNCFVAGTQVATVNGLVNIEDIKVDDIVIAADPENDVVSFKQVQKTYVNETYELTHVTVNGETITSTPSHPYYSPRKGWVDACQLRAGDILVTVNGDYVIVEKVQHEILESPVKIYNFTVEDYHTYYVGQNNVLVHNYGCKNPGGRHGGEAHQAKIADIKSSLTKKGWTVSDNEMRVNVGGGKYRYPDITATKGTLTRYYQVGKQTLGGKPIARELRALVDLGKTGVKTFFVPYN